VDNKTFWTDLNMTRLAIFSSSKGLATSGKEEVQVIEFDNGKHVLNIRYGDRVPSWFDRKVMATVEYLFLMKFTDLKAIRAEADALYLEREVEYRKAKGGGAMSEADVQSVIFQSIKQIQAKYALSLPLSAINSVMMESRVGAKIKESIKVLAETRIRRKSTYVIGPNESLLEYPEFPLLEVVSAMTRNSKGGEKEILTIYLSPFHLYNILHHRFVKSDLTFLNSFASGIAGRLSEYLRPKLYGLQKHTWSPYNMSYDDLCKFLHLKPVTARTSLLRQLKAPLDEMVTKGVIVHWELNRGLFGWELAFHHSINFYARYYKDLPAETRQEVENSLASYQERDDFIAKVLDFKAHSSVNAEDQVTIGYFERYLVLTIDAGA